MQATLARLQQQADQFGGGESTLARRYQLQAAIRQYCSDQGQPGIATRPFDPDRNDPSLSGDMPDEDQGQADDQAQGQGQDPGPGKLVCVRLCDGYFFPLASAGKGGRDAAPAMCQAQCPGAETQAFTLGGSDDITQAVGPGGKSYMELDNALRYQKATVSGCSCRKGDQSWGQALKGAEDMLGTTGSDAPVSADKAAELSRAPAAQPGKKAAPAPAQPAPAAASPAPASSPASGRAAGGNAAGQRQVVGPNGSNVRVIAPPPAPNQP